MIYPWRVKDLHGCVRISPPILPPPGRPGLEHNRRSFLPVPLKHIARTVELKPEGLEPDRNLRLLKDPRAILEHVQEPFRIGQQPFP